MVSGLHGLDRSANVRIGPKGSTLTVVSVWVGPAHVWTIRVTADLATQ